MSHRTRGVPLHLFRCSMESDQRSARPRPTNDSQPCRASTSFLQISIHDLTFTLHWSLHRLSHKTRIDSQDAAPRLSCSLVASLCWPEQCGLPHSLHSTVCLPPQSKHSLIQHPCTPYIRHLIYRLLSSRNISSTCISTNRQHDPFREHPHDRPAYPVNIQFNSYIRVLPDRRRIFPKAVPPPTSPTMKLL